MFHGPNKTQWCTSFDYYILAYSSMMAVAVIYARTPQGPMTAEIMDWKNGIVYPERLFLPGVTNSWHWSYLTLLSLSSQAIQACWCWSYTLDWEKSWKSRLTSSVQLSFFIYWGREINKLSHFFGLSDSGKCKSKMLFFFKQSPSFNHAWYSAPYLYAC